MNEEKKSKEGYLQCSYRLLDVVDDVRIAVLAHKILFRWQTAKKDEEGFIPIRDIELANTVKVGERSINTYTKKLEEIKFIETKRINGWKYYKINKTEAKKYFGRV